MPVADDRGTGDTLYREPLYYRSLFDGRRHDLDFYLDLCRGRSVLEFGVGTGRVALPLARAGARVLGVDLSVEMLAELEALLAREPPEVRERARVVQGDVRTLALDERFERVICPFNGLAHHHTDEQLALFFASVRRHLEPAGELALDVVLPDPSLLAGTTSVVPWLRHPRTGVVCRAEERIDYDPMAQVLTIRTMFVPRDGGEIERLELGLRQLFPQEMLLLLAHHGFEVLARSELGDTVGYVCRPR